MRWISFSLLRRLIRLAVLFLSLTVFWGQNSHAKWHLVNTLEHKDAVNSIAFSTDGQLLASGSKDGTIILWNPLTGKNIRSLKGHNGSIYSVAFSPDGKRLASVSVDEKIILWNPETGVILHTMQHNGVRSVIFNPDGDILASASNLGTIRLWNPTTGKQIQKEINLGHKEAVTSIIFSPDGKLLASGSWDYTIGLWNIEIKKREATLGGHNHVVYSVSFSPDGLLLSSGSWDKTIKLWNLKTRRQIGELSGHTGFVLSTAFSSDGKLLASGSIDNTIRIWNIETKKAIVLKGHSDDVNAVAFRGDNMLASGSSDGTVKLWLDLSIVITDITPEPPEIVITERQVTAHTATFRFSIEPKTASVKLPYYWRLDKKEWTETWETSVTLPNLSKGSHLFEVKAKDMDGNKDLASAEAPFYIHVEKVIVDSGKKLPETEIVSSLERPIKTKNVIIQFKGRLKKRVGKREL